MSARVSLALVVLAVLPVAITGQTVPGTAALSGSWTIAFDQSLDGVVRATPDLTYGIELRPASRSEFVGTYVSAAPDGTYIGNVVSGRTTTVVTMTYHDRGYYNVLAGRLTEGGWFEGAWFDGAGNSGDFRLELGRR